LQAFWMYREETIRCCLRRETTGLFACPGSLSFVDLGPQHHVTAISGRWKTENRACHFLVPTPFLTRIKSSASRKGRSARSGAHSVCTLGMIKLRGWPRQRVGSPGHGAACSLIELSTFENLISVLQATTLFGLS